MTAFRIFSGLAAAALLALLAAPAGGQAPPRVVRVPCLTDGVLLLVGAEVGPQQKHQPDRLRMTFSPRPRPYQLLREGDRVSRGQVLAQMDDGLARVALNQAQARHDEAAARRTEAAALRDFARVTILRVEGRGGDIGIRIEKEHAALMAMVEQYEVQFLAADAVAKSARATLDRARDVLDRHTVRSPAAGVIRRIRKQAGERVRAMEPLFEIEVTDKKG
jgi:hypothetical protein